MSSAATEYDEASTTVAETGGRPQKPWDKLDGETGVAYAAFLIYRDLGTSRNLSAAYKLHIDSRDSGAGASPGRAQSEPKVVPSETSRENSARALVASGRWKQW